MRRFQFVLILLLCCSMTACMSLNNAQTDDLTQAVTVTESTDINNGFVPAPITATISSESAKKNEKEDLADMRRDPPYDFNIDDMMPSDFGEFFTENYDCSYDTYPLLSGTTLENTVTVIQGELEGPTIYLVAGVHGDEEAGWQTGKLLKKISIKTGTLYILAPANRWGAEKIPKSRYLNGKDLNRSFPGNKNGNDAERVANAIYLDICDKEPVFVFDLHEATVVEGNRDYLGSSLIFTDASLFDELYFDLLWATEDGTICSRPFASYAPGPNGSINNTVSTNLKIPVLTVETFRGYQMEERIGDQLDIIQYVLRYYGMY